MARAELGMMGAAVSATARAFYYPSIFCNLVRTKLQQSFHWFDSVDEVGNLVKDVSGATGRVVVCNFNLPARGSIDLLVGYAMLMFPCSLDSKVLSNCLQCVILGAIPYHQMLDDLKEQVCLRYRLPVATTCLPKLALSYLFCTVGRVSVLW
jgi:hypothetical protein